MSIDVKNILYSEYGFQTLIRVDDKQSIALVRTSRNVQLCIYYGVNNLNVDMLNEMPRTF